MTREEALALVHERVKDDNLRKHIYAVEAVMRALARHFGEDEETWGLVGLLHDLDYELTLKDPSRHTLEGALILQEKGLPEPIIHAVKAHADKAPLESRMDKGVYAADPVTGLIVAAALVRPDKKLEGVEVNDDHVNWRYTMLL